MATRFKNVHPLMVYMPLKQRALVKLFSKKQKTPVSQLVREGLLMRMAGEDRYNAGWNDGIDASKDVANNSNAGKMMFPSGRSFSQMICEELDQIKRVAENKDDLEKQVTQILQESLNKD
jgi:hypothetical protein